MGCAGSTVLPESDSIRIPRLDSSIASPCKDPVKIPERNVTRSEAEKLWARDRVSLVKCGVKHKAAVDQYRRVKATFDQ